MKWFGTILGSLLCLVPSVLGCSSDTTSAGRGADGPAGSSSGGASAAGGSAGAARGGDGGRASGGGGSGGEDFTPDYFPTEAWRQEDPAALGYDPTRLDEAVAFAENTGSQGLLVVQDGYIVAEGYFGGFSADRAHESYSVAKSFTSGLVGIAIAEGHLSGVEERVCTFYEAWDCNDEADPRSRIELRHVMTLSTGLDWVEAWEPGASLADNDAIQMSISGNPIEYVLSKTSAHEPGTTFQYSTGDPALLSGVIQTATGMTALDFARDRVFSKIGADGISWNSDATGRTTTFAGLQATVRDYARYGFLYLNRGSWDGEQIIPAEWVERSTNPGVALEDWYGYLWHVNLPVRFDDPELPADGFTAQGVSGQFVTVIPSERLVLVRVAEDGIGAAEYDIAALIKLVLSAKG